MGLITAQGMWGFFRYAVIIIFIVAALLTPGPDPISQLMMAAPLLVLYALSIGICALSQKNSQKKAEAEAAGEFPLVIAYANIIQYLAEKGAPIDWVPLEPAVISVNTVMAGAKASHPNAAKLFIDFTLSKEGQEKLWDFQRIPSRSDVEPKPARLFRGYKRYVVHPEEMQNLDETAKLYSQILKTR